MQLPGDKVKEIGTHGQPTVGEVERVNRAVAEGIGKCLQENMADFHVVDPLDQRIDVFGLLSRIGVINVIQIDMHHAHRIGLLNLRDAAGKGFKRGIPGD